MPTKKPELVPLTHEIWESFHGEPVPCRMKGVALMGEIPLAIAGYADHGEALEVFSYVKDEAKGFPKDIYRGALLVMEWVDQTRKPAYAFRDRCQENSSKLLRRLGFEYLGMHQGEEVWRY